jgi:hypothetical protein
MVRLLVTNVVALGLLTWAVCPAAAQPSSPVGVRAAGMGGAFTAVADDATATVWNPAGLASGGFVTLALDTNQLDRDSSQFIGLGTPPLGLSYYRTSTVGGASGRNRLVVHHAGATVVQSIGDHGLAVGATLGVVRGNGATAFGADAGVMLSGGLGQVGLSVRSLTAPSLAGMRLDRAVRAGVAVHLRQDLLVAADADLTSATTTGGRWRGAALGVESHPLTKLWGRGGVHWNTTGAVAAPIGSVGGSVAVYGSLRVDAQWSFGSAAGDRGWGAGLNFHY